MFAFLTKSWAAYQRQLSLLLPLAVMYALAYISSNALPPLLLPKTAHKFWYFAVAGLVLFWEAYWNAGLIYFLAAALNEQKPKLVSFFSLPSGAFASGVHYPISHLDEEVNKICKIKKCMKVRHEKLVKDY